MVIAIIKIYWVQQIMEIKLDKFNNIKLNQWKINSTSSTSSENIQIVLIHHLTHQQFSLKKIYFSSPTQLNHISHSYVTRSVYPLPGTPKIILPFPFQINPHKNYFNILVQISTQSTQVFIKRLSVWGLMQSLKSVGSTVLSLFYKYGSFKLTKKMIMPASNQLLIWINQEFESNEIQYKKVQQSKGEVKMMVNLLNILSESTDRSDHRIFLGYIRKCVVTTDMKISYKRLQEFITAYLNSRDQLLTTNSLKLSSKKELNFISNSIKFPKFLHKKRNGGQYRDSSNLQIVKPPLKPPQLKPKSLLFSSPIKNKLSHNSVRQENLTKDSCHKFDLIKSKSSNYFFTKTLKKYFPSQVSLRSWTNTKKSNLNENSTDYLIMPTNSILLSSPRGSNTTTRNCEKSMKTVKKQSDKRLEVAAKKKVDSILLNNGACNKASIVDDQNTKNSKIIPSKQVLKSMKISGLSYDINALFENNNNPETSVFLNHIQDEIDLIF